MVGMRIMVSWLLNTLEHCNPLDVTDQAKVDAEVEQTVAVNKEFKERAGFNRRRGAMRRRVHQVMFKNDLRSFDH